MHGRSVPDLQEIFSNEPSHFFPPQGAGAGSKELIPVALNLQFQGPSCGLVGGHNRDFLSLLLHGKAKGLVLSYKHMGKF